MHRSLSPIILITALALACTSGPAADDEAGTSTSPSTTEVDESSDDEATSETSTSTSTTTRGTTDDDEGLTFIDGDDIFHEGGHCDTFIERDCPEGEKCVAHAQGGEIWDANRCVPILGDKAAGEPCMSFGLVEGTDDCDGSSQCWTFGDEGICRPFCGGTADNPDCPPMTGCLFAYHQSISLCMPDCHPFAQDCSDGDGCYFWPNSPGFFCTFTPYDLPVGSACSNGHDCTDGHHCVDADQLPNCDAFRCCTNFCDLELGDAQCSEPGTACVPLYEPGDAPAGYENVGVCTLPP
jgi:hypothetical protein